MQPTNLICHPANSVCSFACTNLWWDVPVRWEIVRIYMDKSWHQVKSQNAQFWNIAISCNVALQRSQNWAVVAFLNLFTYLHTWRADCVGRTMNERLSRKSVWSPVSAMSHASFFVVSLLLLLLAWAMILVSTDVAATKLAMKLLFPVGFYSSRVQFDRANAVYHSSSSSSCCSSLFRHLCGPRTESLYTQYVAYTWGVKWRHGVYGHGTTAVLWV